MPRKRRGGDIGRISKYAQAAQRKRRSRVCEIESYHEENEYYRSLMSQGQPNEGEEQSENPRRSQDVVTGDNLIKVEVLDEDEEEGQWNEVEQKYAIPERGNWRKVSGFHRNPVCKPKTEEEHKRIKEERNKRYQERQMLMSEKEQKRIRANRARRYQEKRTLIRLAKEREEAASKGGMEGVAENNDNSSCNSKLNEKMTAVFVAYKRGRASQKLKRKQRMSQMTAEERANFNAKLREQRRREREKKRKLEGGGEEDTTNSQRRRSTMSVEDRRLEMRYAAALTRRRNRPHEHIGEEEEAEFLELEKARFKALEERRRKKKNLPEMTEEERLKWIQQEKDRSNVQYLDRLQRRALMSEEELKEIRMKQYLNAAAYRAENPPKPMTPEERERDRKRNYRWRKSLTGERLQRFNESLKRSQQKYYEKLRHSGKTRVETPERKQIRMMRQRLYMRRKTLRKNLRKGGFSEEQIKVQLDEFTKKFYVENSYTPIPKPRGRPPRNPVVVTIGQSERVQVAGPSTTKHINIAGTPHQNNGASKRSNPSASSFLSSNHHPTTFLPSSSNITVGSSPGNPQLFSALIRETGDSFPVSQTFVPKPEADEDEGDKGQLFPMEDSFEDDFDGDYCDDEDNSLDGAGGDDEPINFSDGPSLLLPVQSPVPPVFDKLLENPLGNNIKNEEEPEKRKDDGAEAISVRQTEPKGLKLKEEGRMEDIGESRAPQSNLKGGQRKRIFGSPEMCEDCGKVCRDHRAYLSHRRYVHVDPRKCPHPQCDYTYKLSNQLVNHFHQVHVRNERGEAASAPTRRRGRVKLDNNLSEKRDEKSNICPECGKIFKTKCTVDDHIRRIHQGKGFYCDLCPSRGDLQSAGKLWRHKVENHGMTDLPPPPNLQVRDCEFCGEKVLRSYKHHILKKHPEMKDKIQDLFLRKRKATGEKKIPFVKCPQCSVDIQKYSLRRHMRTMHGAEGHQKFPCPKCGFEFNHKYNMTDHLARCLGNKGKRAYKSARCVLCGVWFVSGGELQQHLQESHPQEFQSMGKGENPNPIPLDCKDCSESFSDLDQLRKHLESTHPDSSLKCPECGKVMLSSVELALHISMDHTKEPILELKQDKVNKQRRIRRRLNKNNIGKPKRDRTRKSKPPPAAHSCFRCDEQFATSKQVSEHVQSSHPNCYFPCPRCSTLLFSQRLLDFHVIRICNKTPDKGKATKEIVAAGRIPVHMIRIKCKLCTARSTVSTLSTHLKFVHKIIENSFKCEHCPRTFKTREFWIAHLENEHGTQLESVYEVVNEDDVEKLETKRNKGDKKSRNSRQQKSKPVGRGRRGKKQRRLDSPETDEEDEEPLQQEKIGHSTRRKSQRTLNPRRSLENTLTQPCFVRLVRMSEKEIEAYGNAKIVEKYYSGTSSCHTSWLVVGRD